MARRFRQSVTPVMSRTANLVVKLVAQERVLNLGRGLDIAAGNNNHAEQIYFQSALQTQEFQISSSFRSLPEPLTILFHAHKGLSLQGCNCNAKLSISLARAKSRTEHKEYLNFRSTDDTSNYSNTITFSIDRRRAFWPYYIAWDYRNHLKEGQ